MSVKILIGDVREQLRALPADHVDCVVTSPPYWGLRDYGTGRWEGGDPNCEHRSPTMKEGRNEDRTALAGSVATNSAQLLLAHRSACGKCGAVKVDQQIGLEPTLGEHLAVMVDVFNEVRRVMKPTATLWLNYGDCYATSPNGRSAAATKAAGNDDRTFRDKPFSTIGPIYSADHETGDRRGQSGNKGSEGQATHTGRIVSGGTLKPKDLCMIPNRLAIALQDAGWWVRSEIVWGKPNPMPDSSGKYRPSTAHEKIFLLAKSSKYFYDALAVAMPVSAATHARLSQEVEKQIGSARAKGGRKTNGNMKAVVRKQDGHGRRHDGFNDRYFGGKVAEAGSGIRNNASMNEALAIMPDTRYLRNYEPAPVDVWQMATQSFSEAHFATFPPELAERCIKAGCPAGGMVLDPFSGAGTTGLVADRLQRDAILIELNPEYAAMAERRISGDAPLVSLMAAE